MDNDWKRLVVYFVQIFHKVTASALSVEHLSCFQPWDDIVDCHEYRPCSPEWSKSPFRLDSLLTVDIIFKHKRRKDRLAAVAKAIAVVREKESWENACWICNGKWMNKEVEPSFFSFWPASSNGPFFFLLFAVNLLDWMEEEEETCIEGKNCDGN